MKKIKFIGYPKCSTCVKAYNFLKEKGYEIEYIDIIKDVPSIQELKEYHLKSGLELRKMFNYSGQLYREMKLKDKLDFLSEEEKFKLLASNGRMIKRPIIISDKLITFGFKEKDWY